MLKGAKKVHDTSISTILNINEISPYLYKIYGLGIQLSCIMLTNLAKGPGFDPLHCQVIYKIMQYNGQLYNESYSLNNI